MKNIRADIGENYIFSRDSNSVSKIMIDAKKFKKIYKNFNNEEAVNQYQETLNEKILDDIIKANYSFLILVSKKYQNQYYFFEDVFNDSCIGMIKAVSKFDKNKGYKFISYAIWWIQNNIVEEITKSNHVILPSNYYNLHNKINRFKDNYFKTNGYHVDDDTVMEEFKLDFERFYNIKNHAYKRFNSIDGSLSSSNSKIKDNQDDLKYSDLIRNDNRTFIPDHKYDIDENDVLNKVFERKLDSFSDKRIKIIFYHYHGMNGYEKLNFEEIGKIFNITRSRILQLYHKYLLKMKSNLFKNELKKELYERC